MAIFMILVLPALMSLVGFGINYSINLIGNRRFEERFRLGLKPYTPELKTEMEQNVKYLFMEKGVATPVNEYLNFYKETYNEIRTQAWLRRIFLEHSNFIYCLILTILLSTNDIGTSILASIFLYLFTVLPSLLLRSWISSTHYSEVVYLPNLAEDKNRTLPACYAIIDSAIENLTKEQAKDFLTRLKFTEDVSPFYALCTFIKLHGITREDGDFMMAFFAKHYSYSDEFLYQVVNAPAEQVDPEVWHHCILNNSQYLYQENDLSSDCLPELLKVQFVSRNAVLLFYHTATYRQKYPHQELVFCREHLYRSALVRVESLHQDMYICPLCTHGLPYDYPVNEVVGVIGSAWDYAFNEQTGRVTVGLWDATERKARYAEVDVLRINPDCPNLDWAIVAVLEALSRHPDLFRVQIPPTLPAGCSDNTHRIWTDFCQKQQTGIR